MFKNTEPAAVTALVAAVAAGKTPRAAAREAKVSFNTACRWLGIGAPVASADGIPPNMPLLLVALRRKQGRPVDGPLDQGESLVALKLAAKEVARAIDEFTAVFSEI